VSIWNRLQEGGVFRWLLSLFQRTPIGSRPRSSQWPKVRAEHLRRYPECAACGCDTDLEVHHIIPYHVDPSMELNFENLMTLCGDKASDCHRRLGHGFNWTLWNDQVIRDAAWFRSMLRRVRKGR